MPLNAVEVSPTEDGLLLVEGGSVPARRAEPSGVGVAVLACSPAMAYQKPQSHLVPRTPMGKIVVGGWIVLFLLAMPPVTHRILDRPDVWVAGVPVFFFALFVIYTALIGVLIGALRRGL